MRTRLSLLFNPILISILLVCSAFALDDFGIAGRIVGTTLVALVLWGPSVLTANGWATPCHDASVRPAWPWEAMRERRELEREPPWYRRRYNLAPTHVYAVSGLGGMIAGFIVAICLDGATLGSALAWGCSMGVIGIVMVTTMQLQNPQNPHQKAFEASVDQTFRLAFLALFAAGFWQNFSAGIALMLTGGLYAGVLFMMGTLWGLALLGQFSFRSIMART